MNKTDFASVVSSVGAYVVNVSGAENVPHTYKEYTEASPSARRVIKVTWLTAMYNGVSKEDAYMIDMLKSSTDEISDWVNPAVMEFELGGLTEEDLLNLPVEKTIDGLIDSIFRMVSFEETKTVVNKLKFTTVLSTRYDEFMERIVENTLNGDYSPSSDGESETKEGESSSDSNKKESLDDSNEKDINMESKTTIEDLEKEISGLKEKSVPETKSCGSVIVDTIAVAAVLYAGYRAYCYFRQPSETVVISES